MKNKSIIPITVMVGAGALLSASIMSAQAQDNQNNAGNNETRNDETSQNPQADATQRELEAKAVRIPSRDLASALRASQDGRSARARNVPRGPNMEAMRENLQRTRDADTERDAAGANEITTRDLTALRSRPQARPGLRTIAKERMATREQEETARVKIPLLLPAHSDMSGKMKIYGMQNIYTATATIDQNASFSMSGTCNRVVGGDPETAAFRKRLSINPKRLPNTGDEYHISRNDFGIDISFSKFGCGYVITIECDDPGSDPRCAADDYVTTLAQSLLLANPELAGGE